MSQGGHRQVAAGSPEHWPHSHTRQQRRSPCWRDAGASLCHRFTGPGLSHALTSLWPCMRGPPRLPRVGAFSSARHSPVLSAPPLCCGCAGAGRTWPRRALGLISNVRDWGQPHLWWRAAHPCHRGWRRCPCGPQLLLPGSGHQSLRHVLTIAGGGDEASPAAREAPRARDLGTCPCAGPSGPTGCSPVTAAVSAPAAKRCHFLQLGFYRAGGEGGFY